MLRFDSPAQLTQGIEDNLRSLAVGDIELDATARDALASAGITRIR